MLKWRLDYACYMLRVWDLFRGKLRSKANALRPGNPCILSVCVVNMQNGGEQTEE